MKGFVLLSGGTRGIGKASALALAQRGYVVFAGALEPLDADVRAQFAAHGDGRIVPISLDVSDRASIASAVAAVRERIGPAGHLHALISNAGVDYNGPLQALSAQEIGAMVQVNLLGAILLAREALALAREGASRLIFVGSAMGLWAMPTVSVYASTKWGLEGLSDALRLELAMRGIGVSLVEPGVVRTQMTSEAPTVLARILERMDPTQRAVYEPLMRRIVRASCGPSAGISAEQVADTIVRVVESARPRSRYRVGSDAAAAGLLRHLPDKMRDFVARRAFGLRTWRSAP